MSFLSLLELASRITILNNDLNAKNQQLASAQSEINKKQNELSDKEREITSLKDQHRKDLEEFNSKSETGKPNLILIYSKYNVFNFFYLY